MATLSRLSTQPVETDAFRRVHRLESYYRLGTYATVLMTVLAASATAVSTVRNADAVVITSVALVAFTASLVLALFAALNVTWRDAEQDRLSALVSLRITTDGLDLTMSGTSEELPSKMLHLLNTLRDRADLDEVVRTLETDEKFMASVAELSRMVELGERPQSDSLEDRQHRFGK